jgi:spermidine synthase
MQPRLLIGTAAIPGGDTLRLFRRGDAFSIMLGGNELMNSRLSGSEEALAAFGCASIAARTGAEVLVGGLGMGFTLRAALALLPPQARILVAELVPAVAEWARGPMAPIFGVCLDDPRVRIKIADVRAVIRAGCSRFDVILLDVDNGPDGLTAASNDGLYGRAGLAEAHAALKPGGALAIWSAHRDDAFRQRLERSGFAVAEHGVRAHGKRGAKHVIWVGTRT